jgi:unsaturated rhamnogalacturonyl hydrolase
MGIVDTLESLRVDHPRRDDLRALLRNLVDAIARVQDPKTGVWHQVLDQPDRPGNYLESSASCMFVYAIAKAVRLGHLDRSYIDVARRGYDGILAQFVKTDPQTGHVSLTDTCRVAGLGGQPYRDGSFAYYVSEPRVTNDPKGLAPFILASLEIERLTTPNGIRARGDSPTTPADVHKSWFSTGAAKN